MEKTKFEIPKREEFVGDVAKMARDLRDLRFILTAIAWQQADKTLEVPYAYLEELPKSLAVDIEADSARKCWVFRAIDTAADGEGAGLAADDQVPGGLG